jgi:hypothetical protein
VKIGQCCSRMKLHFCLAPVLCTAMTYGCVAYNFSTDFLPLEKQNEARKPPFQQLVLGVERSSDMASSYDLEKFVENLKKSQIFRAVEYVERISTADLILTSFFAKRTDPFHACLLGFEGQLITIATGGLLPQICKTDHEISFDLYAATNRQQRKTISFRYQTRSILGWAALFYIPSSNWSAKPLEDDYPSLLRAVFYRQANEVQQR